MKKFLPWLLGMLIGIALSAIIGVVLVLVGVFAASDKLMDNGYSTVAISWAAPRDQERPLIYQARVTAIDENGDGRLEVRCTVFIGSGIYQHDMGIIGNASNREDALRRFGKITWTDTELQVGGDAGVVAALNRTTLESHR